MLAQHKDAVFKMRKSGASLSEVAKEFAVTKQAVSLFLKKHDAFTGAIANRKPTKKAVFEERRAVLFLSRWGCSREYWKSVPPSTRSAYRSQRTNALKRGIGWRFTLPSWIGVWEASGKWQERGRGNGYVMARNGDSGPYSPENVYICTQVQNMKDSYRFRPASQRKRVVFTK